MNLLRLLGTETPDRRIFFYPEDPMTLSIIPSKKIANARQWAKTYSFKFLEPGLVSYNDVKMGTLLLKKETIDKLAPTFTDKPLVINHQEVSPGNFEDIAVGYIKSVYYNAVDGWFYADVLVTNDLAHKHIEDGWGVSCAYKVQNIGEGGKYHNIQYDGEIMNGEGEHLALVQNPRYEDCMLAVNGVDAVLYNEKNFISKTNKQEDNKMFFNFFGKKEDKGFAPETLVDIGGGKKAKIGDIIAFNNSVAEKHEIDGKQEIELANGKKVTLEEAVKAYAASLGNASTDKDEDKDEDKAKKEAEAKKAENAKKLVNCGCGGEGDKHKAGCTMYNEDGSDKKKDDKDDKDEKMENEIKALKLENAALKAGSLHMKDFVKLENANKAEQEDALLQNGTTKSGSLESRFENSKKFFVKK